MLVVNIKSSKGLTLGRKYLVTAIKKDFEGNTFYDVLNDYEIDQSNQTNYYFVTIPYSSDLFEVIDSNIPKDWKVKKSKKWLFYGKEDSYQTFSFIINNSAFYARMVDGSEPERSYFFYELDKLYKIHDMDELTAGFNLIPKSHLINIVWPKDVLSDWIDPVDGKVYKSNN